MKVAEKTVAFVKEWVHGTYTKRQYQNYYIVKTDHANFLMKLTEKRECLAIKDPSGHIYIWDDHGDEDNAFVWLIDDKTFTWPNGFSRCSARGLGNRYRNYTESDMTAAVNHISKFRVCERIAFNPTQQPSHLHHISLIAIGDRRFYSLPDHDENSSRQIPLKDWANFALEQNANYHYTHPSSTLIETIPHIEKIERIRGHYVDLAGDVIDRSTAVDGNWIRIPTSYTTTDQIAGIPISEMQKNRPNPFAYGISPWHFNFEQLNKRDETTEENVAMLDYCVKDDNRRTDLPSLEVDWRAYMRARFPADMAANYIAYIEADDAWLLENSEVAKAHALELHVRVAIGNVDGWVHVAKETDKRFGPYAIHIRTDTETFTRMVPTPPFADRLFGGKRHDY